MSHKVVNVLFKALLAPLVIANIGLGGFGVWNLLVSITNYPRFGVGGIQAAFQKYVSDSTATGDYLKASRLLTTGSIIIFGVTSLVSTPFLIYTDQIVEFLNIPADYSASFSNALRFLVIVIIISNTTTAYGAIITGAHRLDLTKKIGMFWLIVESILIVTLLLNGYRLFALALPFGISQIGRAFSFIYFARKVLPEVTLHPRNFSVNVAKDLVEYAGSFHLLGALEMLYLTVVPILVMRYFGPEISGLYAAATRLISLSSLTAESLLLPLLSVSAFVLQEGDQTKDKAVFTYSLKYMIFTGIPLLLFISFFSDQILFAWTGESHELFTPSMFLLAFMGMCSMLARHHMIIYRSRGEKVHDLVWMVIRFGGLLGFGFVIGKYHGYIGLLSGQLIGEVFGLFFMMYAMHRLFKTDYIGILRDSYLQIGAFFALTFLLWYVVLTAFPNQDNRIFTLGVLAVSFGIYILFVSVILWIGLNPKEKEEIRSFIPFERVKGVLGL